MNTRTLGEIVVKKGIQIIIDEYLENTCIFDKCNILLRREILLMALANVYTQVYGQIPEFFSKIKEGQAPAKFTQQHLKDIGFASTNHRAFIPILKALGFLTADGTPSARYHAYRDSSQSRRIMGEAIKEAYSDLFLIKEHPKPADRSLIEGKFKSALNTSERNAELMTKTFFGLLNIADINHSQTNEMTDANTSVNSNEAETHEKQVNEPKNEVKLISPGLHYNIQIHLPATKDIEVYNAIFKSVKEHLYG